MGDDYPLNLRQLCHNGMIKQPNTNIITKLNNNKYHVSNWKTFEMDCDKLASCINEFGIKPGSVISTFMWNNYRHLMIFNTFPNMGIVVNPLNIRLHPKELQYIILNANSQLIFIDADLLPFFETIPKNAFKNIKKFIICGENMKSFGWTSKLSHTIDFDQFLNTQHNNKVYQWPLISENSGTFLNYTSGTTGVFNMCLCITIYLYWEYIE